MSERHHVLLIPGFFGFANFGDLAYFGHARDRLVAELGAAGVDAEIHIVKTHPSASFGLRAERLVEAMTAISGRDEPIHLIGHSSGGVDARIVLSNDLLLPSGQEIPESLRRRVKSVVAIASPHRGTPLASLFDSVLGGKLLALLSLSTMTIIRFGHIPVSALFKIAGLFAKLDDLGPANSTLLDQLFTQLLDDFSKDRSEEVQAFFRDISSDQSLIAELAPDRMAKLDGATPDRTGVRYGCVVTRAREPGLGSAIAAGLDPSAQAMHALFVALYRVTAQMPKDMLLPIDSKSAQAFLDAFGALPFASDNDGIVPTRSQLHGELIAAVRADHHDVIGHFHAPDLVPPHYDWLATGTGFSREQFEALWKSIVRFILT
jgi:hypothetical protein